MVLIWRVVSPLALSVEKTDSYLEFGKAAFNIWEDSSFNVGREMENPFLNSSENLLQEASPLTNPF